jgi:phosphatidylinositol alpha-mannosyltransferase
MACGRPLVVSDITGFRELVNGGPEAVLTRKNDPAAWSRAIIDLIGRPEQRAAMGAAGVAKAKDYAWQLVAERVMAVYRRVMG